MDWFILSDYLKSLPGLMELGRLTEPYILVGITQGRNNDDWAVMRTRDFTPAYPSDEYSKSNMYSKALELTGGAANFAIFLKEELIPRIESEFPGDSSRRCFVGYSLGGLLGVHLLIHNPQLYQYYLLGSPSLWFNDYYLVSELEKLSADSLQALKRVYLSTGEEESWEMLKGFGMLRSAFQEKGFEGTRMKAEIIRESGHVGAMPIALYNGFRFLFPDH
jgi:predicted alpha/beta superfamily hydrolase